MALATERSASAVRHEIGEDVTGIVRNEGFFGLRPQKTQPRHRGYQGLQMSPMVLIWASRVI
jgi:hypothetical protein